MAEELTDEEKIEVSGTVYGFSKEVYDFLHANTPYKGCVEYLRQKFIDTLKQELEKENMIDDFLKLPNQKKLERENSELKEQLQNMINSKSWKITAPLRWIAGKISNKEGEK